MVITGQVVAVDQFIIHFMEMVVPVELAVAVAVVTQVLEVVLH
tara:strand:+ start:554 stop:682 length:129 start_codon:yes stop_codon:yes gene_type:complete